MLQADVGIDTKEAEHAVEDIQEMSELLRDMIMPPSCIACVSLYVYPFFLENSRGSYHLSHCIGLDPNALDLPDYPNFPSARDSAGLVFPLHPCLSSSNISSARNNSIRGSLVSPGPALLSVLIG